MLALGRSGSLHCHVSAAQLTITLTGCGGLEGQVSELQREHCSGGCACNHKETT